MQVQVGDILFQKTNKDKGKDKGKDQAGSAVPGKGNGKRGGRWKDLPATAHGFTDFYVLSAWSLGAPYEWSDPGRYRPWLHVGIVERGGNINDAGPNGPRQYTFDFVDGIERAVGGRTPGASTFGVHRVTVPGQPHEFDVLRPPEGLAGPIAAKAEQLVGTAYSWEALVVFGLATKARALMGGLVRDRVLARARGGSALIRANDATKNDESCVSVVAKAIAAARGGAFAVAEAPTPTAVGDVPTETVIDEIDTLLARLSTVTAVAPNLKRQKPITIDELLQEPAVQRLIELEQLAWASGLRPIDGQPPDVGLVVPPDAGSGTPPPSQPPGLDPRLRVWGPPVGAEEYVHRLTGALTDFADVTPGELEEAAPDTLTHDSLAVSPPILWDALLNLGFTPV